jgi:hypothetical protein
MSWRIRRVWRIQRVCRGIEEACSRKRRRGRRVGKERFEIRDSRRLWLLVSYID